MKNTFYMLRLLFKYVHVCVHMCVRVYVYVYLGTHRAQKRELDPPELELQVALRCQYTAAGSRAWSSARATSPIFILFFTQRMWRVQTKLIKSKNVAVFYKQEKHNALWMTVGFSGLTKQWLWKVKYVGDSQYPVSTMWMIHSIRGRQQLSGHTGWQSKNSY